MDKISKNKPWQTSKKCQGLQFREYDSGERAYRIKTGRYPNAYVASLGVIDEEEAIRIVSQLREHRATGVGWQTIEEMDAQEIAKAKADDIKQTKEIKELIAQDNFEKTNTISNFFDKIYWPLRSQSGNEHTNKSILGQFNKHIRVAVGHITLTELKSTHVRDMMQAMKDKGLSTQSIKHGFNVLQATYNYAALYFPEHYSVTLPPFPGKILKKETLNNSKTCWLEYDEARCLLDLLYNWRDICAKHKLHFKGRDTKDAYGMAVLALFCGLRFGDIADLKWKDVTTAYAYARNPKSGKAYGIHLDVPVVKEMIDERRKLFPRASADDYVFQSRVGKKWIKAPEVFFDALEESQLNYTQRRINNELEKIDFHALRHTFASWLAISGVTLHEIMTLMGHNSIQMTLRYARLNPEYTKKHVMQLADNFNKDVIGE